MIQSEVAVVFRGGRRRWYTKWGAASAEAKATIRAKCECDEGDTVTPPNLCRYHADGERYGKIVRRLARLHLLRFKEAQVMSEGQE